MATATEPLDQCPHCGGDLTSQPVQLIVYLQSNAERFRKTADDIRKVENDMCDRYVAQSKQASQWEEWTAFVKTHLLRATKAAAETHAREA